MHKHDIVSWWWLVIFYRAYRVLLFLTDYSTSTSSCVPRVQAEKRLSIGDWQGSVFVVLYTQTQWRRDWRRLQIDIMPTVRGPPSPGQCRYIPKRISSKILNFFNASSLQNMNFCCCSRGAHSGLVLFLLLLNSSHLFNTNLIPLYLCNHPLCVLLLNSWPVIIICRFIIIFRCWNLVLWKERRVFNLLRCLYIIRCTNSNRCNLPTCVV